MITPEKLAELWHLKYYEVMAERNPGMVIGDKPWDEIPTLSRRTAVEICRRILSEIDLEDEPYKPKKKYEVH